MTILRNLVAAAAIAVATAALVPAAPAGATPPVAPTVLLPNVQVAEGASGTAQFLVNVALSAPNPFDHQVTLGVYDFSSTPLPGGGGATYGTATPGSDYVAFDPFHLVFRPGQQVATFPIRIKGDRVVEGDEEIDVRFGDTVLTVGDNDIDLVLVDDDATGSTLTKKPLVNLPNQVVPEADSGCFPFKVSVLLDRPAPVAGTIDAYDFTTTPLPGGGGATYGTATPGTDYQGFGTVRLPFSQGARASTLTVRLCGDTAVEADEEVDVRFAGTTAFAVGDNDIDLVLGNED